MMNQHPTGSNTGPIARAQPPPQNPHPVILSLPEHSRADNTIDDILNGPLAGGTPAATISPRSFLKDALVSLFAPAGPPSRLGSIQIDPRGVAPRQ